MDKGPGNKVRFGHSREADDAVGGGMETPAAGDVIGMHVGVERSDQLETQLADQGEVTVLTLEHRIDQHRLSRGRIRQQVGESAGVGIQKLTKQQGAGAGGKLSQRRNHRSQHMNL